MIGAMKKIFNILCVAAAIVALASCAKENLGKVNTGSEKTFQAGFGATRTAIDDTYETTWVKGDQILILNAEGDTDPIDIPDASEGQSTTTITTTIPDSDTYYAVYGSPESVMDGDNIDIFINDEQTGKWADAQVAAAVAVNQTFALKNVSSVIEFEVSDQVNSVEFVAEGKFGTEAFVSFPEGTPAIEIQQTADMISVSTENVAGKYYASTFPTELENLTIKINYESTSKEIVIDTPISLTAGNILSLGDIETRAGKTYKVVSKETFSAISGNIDADGAFTYEAFKGNAGTAPTTEYNNSIRTYTNSSKGYGNYIEIVSVNGDKIKGVKITTGKNSGTQFVLTEDSEPFDINDTTWVSRNSYISYIGLNASKVTLYNAGTKSDYKAEVYGISVTYEIDPRITQTLSFPQASYIAEFGKSFSAPAVSGAMTPVTYSTSNPDVATVDASTGAVTLVAAGECTISAKAAESDMYKEGNASYSLTVASYLDGIAGIKEFLRDDNTTIFVASVEDMLITYTKLDAYPYIAYAEDKNGDAIYFYATSAGAFDFKVGDKFTGLVSGTGLIKNNVPQIGEINLSVATKTSDNPVTPHVVTIADLNASYADYEFQMIKIEDATVDKVFSSSATGTISQESSTVSVRGGSQSTLSVTAGSVIDLVCFPSYYNTDKQVMVWKQDQITVKGGVNTITMASTQTVQVGSNLTIGATCLAGTVSYEITEGSQYITLANGIVTGVAEGTATIKATSPSTGSYTGDEATCTITVDAAGPINATVKFGTNNDIIVNAASVTGTDDKKNSWTVTTVGTTSFTNNKSNDYSQIGSSKNPATSITFTTTLPKGSSVSSVEAKFGGFNGTSGAVSLKVGDTEVGSGSLSGTEDVVVSSTKTASGTAVTVTVTDIAKGVKAYYLKVTYETAN